MPGAQWVLGNGCCGRKHALGGAAEKVCSVTTSDQTGRVELGLPLPRPGATSLLGNWGPRLVPPSLQKPKSNLMMRGSFPEPSWGQDGETEGRFWCPSRGHWQEVWPEGGRSQAPG